MARQPDALGIENRPERVVGVVEALLDAGVLLGRVSRARRAARHRLIWRGRCRKEEVDGVLRPVEEGPPIALGRNAFLLVGGFPRRVALALPLRIEGEHHVAGLRERLRRVPVQLLVGLDRTVGDHDPGAMRRAGACGPDVTRDRRAIASRVVHGLHDAVATRLPEVEARVSGAAILAGGADVVGELPSGIVHLLCSGGYQVLSADVAKQQLVPRGVVDPLALLDLGEVLRLGGGTPRPGLECLSNERSGERGAGNGCGQAGTARPAAHPLDNLTAHRSFPSCRAGSHRDRSCCALGSRPINGAVTKSEQRICAFAQGVGGVPLRRRRRGRGEGAPDRAGC